MHWIAFAVALMALILARMLRAPGRSGIFTGLAGFAIAFIAVTVFIRFAADQAHITRPTDYDGVVSHAVTQVRSDPDAPLVVFVGASYSRNALDDIALTKALRARGYPHRAVNLSLEGASLQERQAHIESFIRLAGRAPDVVFLELAHEYDDDPVYVFRVAKFSDRAIEQFSPDAAFWSAKGLAQGQCHGKASCAKAWLLLQAHTVMNSANLGLLATGRAASDIAGRASYDPQDAPREVFNLTTGEITAQLADADATAPDAAPSWARLFRQYQRDDLAAAGARRVAYYYPPVLSGTERNYVANICRTELSDFPCIAPVDKKLLKRLSGEIWFDERHLQRKGADIYTSWLADQIDQWGALR